jgi:hypothetical protein
MGSYLGDAWPPAGRSSGRLLPGDSSDSTAPTPDPMIDPASRAALSSRRICVW